MSRRASGKRRPGTNALSWFYIISYLNCYTVYCLFTLRFHQLPILLLYKPLRLLPHHIPRRVRLMYWASRLHTARSCVCSRHTPFSFMSYILSVQVVALACPDYSSPVLPKPSLFCPHNPACPNYLNLFSCTFHDIFIAVI